MDQLLYMKHFCLVMYFLFTVTRPYFHVQYYTVRHFPFDNHVASKLFRAVLFRQESGGECEEQPVALPPVEAWFLLHHFCTTLFELP